MKWWQASLAVILYIAMFTTVEVGWHWYISTELPLAALMRHIYLHTNRSGFLMFDGFPDTLFPIIALSAGVGAIARRQRIFLAAVCGLWAGLAATAVMPLYTHWLHPFPPPKHWPLYPWGWRVVLTPYSVVNSLVIAVGSISAQRSFRPGTSGKGTPPAFAEADNPGTRKPSAAQPAQGDYRSDAQRAMQISQQKHCSIQKAIELVDQERAARRRSRGGTPRHAGLNPGGEAVLGQADAGGVDLPDQGASPYTSRQIWAVIRLMRVRGWGVEQAAKSFHIPPEVLRGRMQERPPECTPGELKAIAGLMREKGWTVEQAAELLQVPEQALRRQISETA